MTVNTYKADFHARCPVNGARIHYRWTLNTFAVVPVESINDTLDARREGLHEDIADALFFCFGGTQTLIAEHHGVTIETLRASREPSNVRAKRETPHDQA
jgi:hypothetical protein